MGAADYARHAEYCYINPVKHGLVGDVAEWPFSSFRHCVAKGIYPLGWVTTGDALADAGESDCVECQATLHGF